MAKLDFFRRPVLIGNTARRTQNATIRGSVRRHDADGISATPYVPGITGGTLSIKIEGTTYTTAAFASDDYAAAIALINATIGGHGAGVANGEAFDSDGVITIRSTSVSGGGAPLGATGSVEITGGSAAAALGFNLTFHTLKAYGGEFASTPEGRVGNPFRTAFPTHSENLTTDSVNRAMSLLATNLDMLYADNNREDTMLMKVTTFTNNGTYISLPAGVSVPIGLAHLSGTSTKEDLAPFFLIVDETTKQPHASRVVAVVKGTPGAAYPTGWPYANQTLWSDNLGRNLLGQAVDKMAAGVAITAITEGKYVTCPGASFLSTVSVEDFVTISSATNFNSSDNNGLKWVVEEVVSNTILALRPMSQGELFLVGTTPTSVQPQMDLAGDIGVGQSFGNLVVRTGAYATVPVGQPASLNLVVSPAIPATASVELWMASPMCWMDSGPYDMQTSSGQMLKTLASDLDPQPNGILAAPAVAIIGGGAAASIGAFYVRWHGRVIHVPSQTFTAPADPFSFSVVYWEEATNSLKSYVLSTTIGVFNPTTIFNGPAAGDPSVSPSGSFGFPVSIIGGAAGVVTAVESIARVIRAGETCTLTVGHGGQFTTLQEASTFLLTMSKANAETTGATGAFSHVEIVLLSSQTLTAGVSFSQPDIVIRGVSPAIEVTVNFVASNDVFQNTLGGLRLQDVVLNCPGAPSTIVGLYGTFGKCELRNVKSGTGVPMGAAALAQDAGVDVVLTDCNLNLCGQVVTGPAARNIYITRSVLTYTVNAYTTTPQVIASVAFSQLFIDKSSFSGWKDKTAGVLFAETGSTTFVAVRDSYFDFGAQTAAAQSWFCTASNAKTVFSNCLINMPGSFGINAGTGILTTFDNCNITCNSFGGSVCFAVAEFTNNKVMLSVDTLANPNNSVVGGSAAGGVLVDGNRFLGVQPQYWINVPANSRVSNNYFAPTASAFTSSSAIILAGAHCSITGNSCTSTVTMTSGIVANGVGVEVSGNYFDLSTATTQGLYCNDANLTVAGNYIKANKPLNLAAGALNYQITGNQLLGTAANALLYGTGTFTGNYFTGVIGLGTSNVYVTFNECIFENTVTIDGVGYIHFADCTFRASGTVITGPQVGLGEPAGRKALISRCTFFGITTLTDCIVEGSAFDMGAVAAIGVGAVILDGCEATSCNFLATTVTKDIVRMRNSVLIGCSSSGLIYDHASLTSTFNYVYDTYCYALVSGPALYQGMFFSDRTYKLVVDGCDTATINGDPSTNSGPRDVSISNTRADQLWMGKSGLVTVTNCKVGLRNTRTNNTLSSRFEFTFWTWSGANSALTGVVTFAASTSVTGVGTKFLTEVQVGDGIMLSTDAPGVMGKVVSISSDTVLTLASNYTGTAAAGSALCGAARGTFIGNDIDLPTGNLSLDSTVVYGTQFYLSGNKITGGVQIEMGSSSIAEKALVSRVSLLGNQVSNLTRVRAGATADPTYLMVSGNQLDGGFTVDSSTGAGTWGTSLIFTGAVSNNNFAGAADFSYCRGIAFTGNSIVCTPSNQLLRFFRCLDVVIDGNYIYKVASNGFNKLIEFTDVRRARLTNNILGSAWVAPDGTELILFGGNAGPSPYDLVIMGNHQYFVGTGASNPTQASLVAGATVWWLADAATTQTSPARLGGTVSAPTTP